MKEASKKEKIINGQQSGDDGDVNAKGAPAANEKKKDSAKSKLTTADLKGKKVDGDPELESDQPVKQVY